MKSLTSSLLRLNLSCLNLFRPQVFFSGFAFSVLLISGLLAGAAPASAQSVDPAVRMELNKAEPQGDACRVYLLFENGSDLRFDRYSLDFVLFDQEGVIAKRLAVSAAPLRPGKAVVKLYDIGGLACEQISRVLINGITECVTDAGERQDCIDFLEVGSRTEIVVF